MDKPQAITLCLAVLVNGCATNRPEIVDSFTLEGELVEVTIRREGAGGMQTFIWTAENKSNWPLCMTAEVSYAEGATELEHERVVTVFPGASVPVAKLVARAGDTVSWSYTGVDIAWFTEGGEPCRLKKGSD